jgi:hypothetical protein
LFEAALVTETLSTFLMVASIWLSVRMSLGPAKRRGIYYVFVGTLTGLAALTKPLLLMLFPVFLLFFLIDLFKNRVSVSAKSAYLTAFVTPSAVILLGWCSFNKITLDYFGLTTLTGYNLSQHSGAFMELAPEKYSEIRDIYLKYRDANIQKSGTHSMTIWRAIPEMQAKTGLSYSDLSKEMERLSMRLFVGHPVLYLKGVLEAWLRFWKAPIVWLPEKVRSMGLRTFLEDVWQVERYGLVALKIIFLFSAGYLVVSVVRRRTLDFLTTFMVFIVLVGSIVQALTEFGDNARYSFPFQPLMLYVAVISCGSILRKGSLLLRRRHIV